MLSIPIDTTAAAIGAAIFLLYKLTSHVFQTPTTSIPHANKGSSPEVKGASNGGAQPAAHWWHAVLLGVSLLLALCCTFGPSQRDTFADCLANDIADALVSEPSLDFSPTGQARQPQFVITTADAGLESQMDKSVPHEADAVQNNVRQANAISDGQVAPSDTKEAAFATSGAFDLEAASQASTAAATAATTAAATATAAADDAEKQITAAPTMDVVSEAPLTIKVSRQVVSGGTQAEYMRSAYYGTLNVGTPSQPMTVVFDTGSGQLVLPSAYCNSPTCKMHRRYRRSKSSTGRDVNFDGDPVEVGQRRDAMSVSYGTGNINGVAIEDIICLGSSTGQMNQTRNEESHPAEGCINMRFLAATYLSEDPFAEFAFDGIVGLGMEGLSQNREFNFLHVIGSHLKDLGSSNPQTFAVFLAKQGEDSEIALGGWSSAHAAESVSWVPVFDAEMGHWIIPMRGLRIDGKELDFCKDGTCRAAVDTGTSLLAVPSESFPTIFEGLRHTGSLAGHCMSHGPQLQIDLGHFTVVVGPREYAEVVPVKKPRPKKARLTAEPRVVRTDLRCFAALMMMDFEAPMGPKLFLLGEPVLQKYYTVFDAERQMVGIARAAHRQALDRGALLMMVPEVGKSCSRCRANPTMFDIFRWRAAVRQPRWSLP